MAQEAFEFRALKKGGLLRLQKQLENPGRLLRPIGMLLLADAQKAFKEQKLGTEVWKERYPRQKPPKVNVAGIIADFTKGTKTPPKRRFQGRPALKDTGMLRRSLSAASKAVSVNDFTVSVGTTVPYAKRVHDGGVSKQRITDGVKELLGEFLKKKRNKQYRPHLGHLFQKDELKTKVGARPFLGVTPQAAKRIIRYIQMKLSPPLQGGSFQEGLKI